MERERVVLIREVYKECMRNHAAKLGTYAADGCCEYTADAARPGSLSCAACGCHRNFHRKVFLDGHLRRHDNHHHQQQQQPAQAAAEERRRHRCPEGGSRPRRARTKFTEEQKARMASFAERIGWKVPRRADGGGDGEAGDDVTRFCLEIGVSRQVFKVWMHNHRSGGGGGGAASSSMSQTAASGGDEEAS